MDKPEIIVKALPFPSHTATESEKRSKDYGLRVGKAIEGEWFSRTGSGCRYFDRYADFHMLRRYARGEQPIGMYQDLMKVNGDMSHLNLDWRIVPIANKFVDIVVNGMSDKMYSIKAQAEDVTSAEKKNLFQQMVEADMYAKDFLKQTKEQFGIDAYNVNPDDIPENDEELGLYMNLNYKAGVEIASEIAINTIFELNDYNDSIRPALHYDLVVIGKAAAVHEFFPGIGIQLRYVDPAKLIHSYTEKADHSDCFYFGHVETVHYTELRKINPDLTDEDLKEIRLWGASWYGEYAEAGQYVDSPFMDETVTLLFFSYKTDKRFVYKKKYLNNGGERVIERDETFVPDGEGDMNFERKDVVKEVWYEGVLILGSNHLIKWDLQKNLVKPKATMDRALPNYIVHAPRMYKGEIDSTVRRMIPHLNQIQFTHLKIQQVAQRVNPDGIYLDADGLAEIDLGQGSSYGPREALDLFFQTGSVIGRSNTQEGEFNNARIPIQELGSRSGFDKIQSLITLYNQHLSMIRDVTGLNEARDGSQPDSRGLVGLQKMAAAASNVATRHILDASVNITKRLAQGISLRISDILKYAPFADEFAMQIGKYNMALLDDMKDLPLSSLGIFIELEPEEEEKQNLENNIQMALSRNEIGLEDAIDIRTIKNIKMANQMLKVKKRTRLKAAQKREDEQSAIQMQINMQSQQAAAEQKMQTAQVEAQAKISVEQAKTQGQMAVLEKEAQLKLMLMEKELEFNMQLKGVESQEQLKKDMEKEKAKDERVKKQGTVQSKLIEQRKKDLPAIDFESSEDDLSGFDLNSFMPR